MIEIALLIVSSLTDKPVPNLDPTSSTLALFHLFSLCAIIAESFFLYHISAQLLFPTRLVSDPTGRHYQD